MSRKKEIPNKTVERYLNDENYRHLPNLTLAKLLFAKENPVFNSVDHARSTIRRARGNAGNAGKKSATHQSKAAEHATKLNIANPFHLPASDETIYEQFILPKSATRILLLSDVHVPYHNIKALSAAIDFGIKNDANTIIFNGDTLDCYQLSRFQKDPRKRSFADELESCRDLLRVFRQLFDGVPIYFKLGNHEERFENYMKTRAPELLGNPEFELKNLLRSGELGITFIGDKRIIRAGKLNILHGHEFGQSIFSPVNPARGYYNRAKANVICGHNHQSSNHSENNLDGNVVTTWSTGCLCELNPAYLPINKWNHGFAFVTIDDNANFYVDNMKIIDGKIA